jgi:EAL domain-containing protein (putative c-di-GMP-specific phosphodiesterase class I)
MSTPTTVLDRTDRPSQDASPRRWTIEKVIEERAIRTLFQPIIHLDSKTVVGFEALTRGPEGSNLESPIALLEAAARADRLGDLDWLCRVTAMRAASASGLPAGLAWLINVEPGALATPCPDYLLPEFVRASANLRMIFEFVERDIASDIGSLLTAAADVRDNSWGVALDDVGVVDGSLVVMPMVRPDVVKLDGDLLKSADDNATARVVAAVLEYASRHRTAILAECIETPEDEAIARAFGAEFGQGYYYGRPGPLPASVPTPRAMLPIRRHVDPVAQARPAVDATVTDATETRAPVTDAPETGTPVVDARPVRRARPETATAHRHDSRRGRLARRSVGERDPVVEKGHEHRFELVRRVGLENDRVASGVDGRRPLLGQGAGGQSHNQRPSTCAAA